MNETDVWGREEERTSKKEEVEKIKKNDTHTHTHIRNGRSVAGVRVPIHKKKTHAAEEWKKEKKRNYLTTSI